MMDAIRPRRLALAAGLAGGLVVAAWAAPPISTTPPFGIRDKTPIAVAFTHATIVVSPDKTIENGTLVVRDGRVAAVGAGLPVPAGMPEIDLTGLRIVPGFIDPYTDYGIAQPEKGGGGREPGPRRGRGRDPQYLGTRTGATAWNDALHAERNAVDGFAPDAKAAEALWKRGVTAVMSANRDGILRGRGFVAALAEGLPNDVLLVPYGPQFASFDKGSSQQEYPSSLMGSIALLRQTFLDAKWYQTAQAAWRKDPSQPPLEINRGLGALAGYQGPIIFETDEDLSLMRAARIGQEMGLPMVHVGSNFEFARAADVAALGQTLILPVSFPAAPSLERTDDDLDVTLADLRQWERAPSNAATLAGKGVKIAFTGYRLRDDEDFLGNVRRTIARGLPEKTALAALTTVPAEIAGIASRAGTLDPGKRADLLVTDGDILASADAGILAVYVGGVAVKQKQPLTAPDFRGHYRLSHGGQSYDLVVRGSRQSLCGTLSQGKSEHDLDNVEATTSELHFSADLAPSGPPPAKGKRDDDVTKKEPTKKQLARFTLVRIGDAWQGWAALPDGSNVEVTAERLPPAAVPAKDKGGDKTADAGSCRHGGPDKKNDLDTQPLVSKVTFPNVAFGFETQPQAEDVLVKNATVWTSGPAGVLEGADVLVRGGKIAAVGKNLAAAPGARVIDGTGKHVTPGMIDEHSHVAISKGVNEGSHAVTAEVRIGDVVDPEDISVYRALAGGTTAAQLLHGSANPIGGQAQIVKLRWGRSAEEMKFAGAPPTIKFALGENVKQSNWGDNQRIRYPQTRMGVETIMRDAFTAARENQADWKRYDALSAADKEKTVPPRRDLTLETLGEILDSKRFVHCHSYVQSEILMLMRLAEEEGFRIQTFTHILEGYKVAPEMAKHGSGASTFSDWWAYKFEVYDAIPYNTCLLHDRGVVTSINSDSEDLIRRLNTEAGKSVMYCGMEPAEALKLATINPAKQLKIDDRVGSLEVGKDADFVIWTGNPLSQLSRVEETWVDGTQLFSRQRDAAMRQAIAAERQALITKALAAGGGGGGGGGEHSAHKLEQEWHCDDQEDVWHARH